VHGLFGPGAETLAQGTVRHDLHDPLGRLFNATNQESVHSVLNLMTSLRATIKTAFAASKGRSGFINLS
jgi:hypothetical protein